MQVWKHLFQQANYLNYKDKGVMAGKRNYSSHKYILWKLDLNFLALNVWIRVQVQLTLKQKHVYTKKTNL